MKHINSDDWLKIPTDVATCPECECQLWADVFEWEIESREITEGGFTIECVNEDYEDEDTRHRHWQSEWQPVINKVFAWLSENVRVAHST